MPRIVVGATAKRPRSSNRAVTWEVPEPNKASGLRKVTWPRSYEIE